MNMFHPNDQIVSLSGAPNPALAHIWESALRQEGIHCQVVGDFLDAGIGDVPGLQPEIWIRRQDITQAQAVLGRLQSLAARPLSKQTAVAFAVGPDVPHR
jgi:hypothetical protein